MARLSCSREWKIPNKHVASIPNMIVLEESPAHRTVVLPYYYNFSKARL